MVQVVKDVVTWLKQWFYEKSEVYAKTETYSQEQVNTALGNKVNVAQGSGNSDKNVVTNSSGNITTENKVSVGSGLSMSNTNQISHTDSLSAQTSTVAKKIKYNATGHITGTSPLYGSDIEVSSSDSTKIDTALGNKANSVHTHSATDVTDSNAHSHIGTSASANQGTINTAIDTAIGNLQSIRAIEIVTELDDPVTEANMGKLYIISENSKVNVYYAVKSGTSPNYTYSWHKMDTDILDEYSVAWNDVTGKPSSFPPSSHTHGQVTNDGKITSTAVTVASGDNIVITDASDSSKVKRVANLLAGHIQDEFAHTNIGSSANDTQETINSAIDTALSHKISTSVTAGLVKNDGSIDTNTYLTSSSISGKSDKTATIGTTITLVDKGETNEGCIIFNTIS